MNLARRDWAPASAEDYVQELANRYGGLDADRLETELTDLVARNRGIHESECINLNPATNIMTPAAEALLGSGLGNRPSLGYPGDKYEMGLEAIERIEVMAASLAARVFDARYVEIRVPSGALANLYAFMATCQPGDTIIVPDPQVGGHVTHHQAGAAGLYGLNIIPAPVDAENYTIDVDALARLARKHSPKLITLGASLNLFPHPVAKVREIADETGAKVLFDAAHACGLFAGRAWPNPLSRGAHLMTMSTYKSLGGPPGGLIVSNEADLAERLDRIAFPGLTANFDAGKSAALAVTLLDWLEYGEAYTRRMQATASALANALSDAGLPVYAAARGCTESHQFALDARTYGGGQTLARRLRTANLLACGIGLPGAPVAGDMAGLRLGTPEVARLGMTERDMQAVAGFIGRVLADAACAQTVAGEVSALRKTFKRLHFVRHA